MDAPSTEDDLYKLYADVFKKFQFESTSEEGTNDQKPKLGDSTQDDKSLVALESGGDNGIVQQSSKDKQDGEKPVSKRRIKELSRMSVAELKHKVSRPQLVESHDVTAKDPVFLLHMKSVKNSIPVPRHWNSKRRYLQGKRGYEKPPFQLPDFIRQTGIMEMRDSNQDKDSGKSLKAKTRERVQPKVGKLQMDYQQLYDAFFKWQTIPRLTIHGDLYYEGKEFEKRFKMKPGELSDELRKALGMPTGPDAKDFPPPWFAAMKRHGPPPSYPGYQLFKAQADPQEYMVQ